MNTINNPTEDQIRQFCSNLLVQLLSAFVRGSEIKIGQSQETKDITGGPSYGNMVVDVIYTSAKFKAEFRERGY